MTSIARRLDKHFVACAAAAAGAALFGAVNNADAGIVWSGIVNINIPSTTAGVYLNVATGGTAGTNTLAGWDINPWASAGLTFSGGTNFVRMNTTTAGVSNVPAGTLIDGTDFYTSGAAQTSGTNPFAFSSSSNLVGFRFTYEGFGTRYGWMRISLGSSLAAQPRSIVEYAYEDSGAGILAGEIPAPGALALLGLAGLAGSRRRRS